MIRPPPRSTLFPYTTLFRPRRRPRPRPLAHRTRRPRHRPAPPRSEEHTSELQSPCNLVCRLLLEKKQQVGVLVHQAVVYRVDNPQPQFLVMGEHGGVVVFFLNDTATTEIYTLSLHDALPI